MCDTTEHAGTGIDSYPVRDPGWGHEHQLRAAGFVGTGKLFAVQDTGRDDDAGYYQRGLRDSKPGELNGL